MFNFFHKSSLSATPANPSVATPAGLNPSHDPVAGQNMDDTQAPLPVGLPQMPDPFTPASVMPPAPPAVVADEDQPVVTADENKPPSYVDAYTPPADLPPMPAVVGPQPKGVVMNDDLADPTNAYSAPVPTPVDAVVVDGNQPPVETTHELSLQSQPPQTPAMDQPKTPSVPSPIPVGLPPAPPAVQPKDDLSDFDAKVLAAAQPAVMPPAPPAVAVDEDQPVVTGDDNQPVEAVHELPLQSQPPQTPMIDSDQIQTTPTNQVGPAPVMVQDVNPVSTPQPPVVDQPQNANPAVVSGSTDDDSENVSQKLADQNIFYLLGISQTPDADKEKFLDELQKVIWEDFLAKDLELLITEEEMAEFKKISAKTFSSEDERQSAMIEYLEKLIPDLEKIMLDKALELKGDMFKERLKEFELAYASEPVKLARIKQAQVLVGEDDWRGAAQILNSVR